MDIYRATVSLDSDDERGVLVTLPDGMRATDGPHAAPWGITAGGEWDAAAYDAALRTIGFRRVGEWDTAAGLPVAEVTDIEASV